MWSPRGIEPREGAELSKRDSVCQRSSQGAKAPQRSARAQRGRDSLPRHLELTRTSAKRSFSFTERPAEIASRNFGPEWDELSALRPLGKARPGIRRQNGTRFPFTALGGSCVPDPALRTGCIFRVRPRTENASQSFAEKRDTLSGACLRCPCASRCAISSPPAPDIPPTFAPLYRPFDRLSARAGILKTILFLCNTMQVRPARSEGGRDGEDTRR